MAPTSTTCIGCLLPFGLKLGDDETIERSESMPNALCKTCCEEWEREDSEAMQREAGAVR